MKRSRFDSLILAAALVLSTLCVSGQTQLIRADRLVDVRSGNILLNAYVIVEEGRISGVGSGRARVPTSTKVVDLGDATLLPGFMDMHTHLTMEISAASFGLAVREGVADRALEGAYHAKTTLMAGFTTVRDVGSGGFADVALKHAIEKGFAIGPRIIPAGHSLGITGGHCDTTGFVPGVLEGGPEDGIADGVDEVLKAVRYQIKHGALVIKTCATAGVLSFEGPVGAQQYSSEELEAMVREAARHGVKVAAHAHGSEGILAAVRAGVASIEHGSMLTDEIISEMKSRGTYLVPTTYLATAIDMSMLPPPIRAKAQSILPLARESLAKAIGAGVSIAFGTDAAVYPHGDNAREFAAMVEQGMSEIDALRSATVNSADLLGLDDRGALEVGKLADIVGVSGNPLEDITVTEKVVFVMKGGAVAKSPKGTPMDAGQ